MNFFINKPNIKDVAVIEELAIEALTNSKDFFDLTSEKATNELGYTIRPIDETIEDNLDFAMDFYFIKRIKKKKSLTK